MGICIHCWWVLTGTIFLEDNLQILILFYIYISQDFIYLFLDREEGREKESERNINVWLPFTHPLRGTWPTTQACALTGNQTGDPLVRRLALNPLSHTSQGKKYILCISKFFILFDPAISFLDIYPKEIIMSNNGWVDWLNKFWHPHNKKIRSLKMLLEKSVYWHWKMFIIYWEKYVRKIHLNNQ